MQRELNCLCVSDVHAEEQALEFLKKKLDEGRREGRAFDVVIAAGDLTSYGPLSFAHDFFEAIEERKAIPVAVHGNLDSLPVKEFIEEKGYSVHARTREILGYKFAGFGGGTWRFGKTAFEYKEEEIEKELTPLVDSKTILVTHFPPFGTFADEKEKGLHVGSRVLRKIIEEKKPLLNVCGHIHETFGVGSLGSTKIIKLPPLMQLKAYSVKLPGLETKVET